MKKVFCAILLVFGLQAKAQLDTIGSWLFGLSGIVTIGNLISNSNTNAGVGAGLMAFAHFEPNECTNYFVALAYSSNPFLYTQETTTPQTLIGRSYVSLLGERGISVARNIRFQYGAHLRVLTNLNNPFDEWSNMNPMDAGVNISLFYYSTPQISLGLRYMQGFVPVLNSNTSEQAIRGLNSQLNACVNIRLF
jgi:hypothetical protein